MSAAATRNRRIHAAWRAWLKRQRHRQDPVGDFARDFLEDVRIGCARDLRTLSGIDFHLSEVHDADEKVLDARDRAWREWEATDPEILRRTP